MKSLMTALERRSLPTKLALGFLTSLLVAVAIGVGNVVALRAVSQNLHQMYENDLLGVSHAKDVQIDYTIIGREIRQALLTQDPVAQANALKTVEEARVALRRDIAELRPRVVRQDNIKLLALFETEYARYESNVNQALTLLQQGQHFEASRYVSSGSFRSAGMAASAALNDLTRNKELVARQSKEAALRMAEEATRMTIWSVVLGVGLSTLFAWVITRSIRVPSGRVRHAVEALARGDLQVAVPHTDFANETGALANAVLVLQKGAQVQEEQGWLKSNLAQISAALQTANSFAELTQTLFSNLSPLIHIGHGVFYVHEEDAKRLRLLGGYAYRERKALNQYFALGEGLVGQSAMERAPIILSEPPADYVRIGSGLGEAVPRSIAVLPVLRNDRLLGVLELATLASFGPREQALLDGVLPILAMNLEILERSVRTNKLLEETQRQAAAMKEQAATLEEQAEELEAQQQALKSTETWYRSIIESAPDGMLVTDERGIITLANPKLEAMFGYEAGGLTGRPIEMLVPETSRTRHVGLRDGYLASGADLQAAFTGRQLQGVRQSGETFPVEVGLARLPELEGRGHCVCASVRDITERKAAQDELRRAFNEVEQSKQLIQAVLDNSPTDIYLKDIEGRFLMMNHSFDLYIQKHLNLTMDQLLGHTIAEFVGEEADRWGRETDQQVLQKGELMEFEHSIPRDWGTEVRQIFKFPLRDNDGDIYAICVIGQDISEKKRMEEAMRSARDAAEEATKAKSDFLANMSHEIRTPMNAIIGMSHLALQTNLDKRQRNYIEKVHRSGENLLGIINDILDFSKIEAGKMGMETIAFRLEDVMDNLANLVGMKAEDKGLELLFNTAPDVPTALQGDPLRLGQVLINLGNNAVKFTDRGEIVVGTEVVSQDDTGVELHFWVKDSGIGMTPEQCSKMFQSFSQADASTTRKYGGTGLGLAISKNLVELMQGRIWVESEAGKGSVFHFHARFGLQADPQPRRMFRADELLGVRVLVVDDNATAREILSTMARTFGLEVDVAWDGAQALQMVAEADRKQLPYDLVLMDWKMPVMDGVEAVRQLQATELRRVPTVIMVTAYGREEATASAQQRGVQLNSVLTKPVTPSTLLEAIGEALGRGTLTETRAAEKAGSNSEAMAALAGARVLLVEDNDMNQELAMELLGNAHIQVVLANHGREALDILARDAAFDGVLMDCQMPIMDGYTATREIRKNPAFKNLPVIAMTANAMAGDREKVLEAGMWDHIAKPLNVGEMFATIAKWIKPAKAAVAAGSAGASRAADGFDGFPPLPGIDVQAGLDTTMGNAKLYTRLLLKFRDAQAGFVAQFRRAQAEADPEAPTRLAHTLKGNAGNIGASDVQRAAGALEQASREGAAAAHIDALLQATVQALQPVLTGLAALSPQGPGSAPAAAQGAASPGPDAPPAPDAAQLGAALEQLRQLLAESDAAAIELVDNLQDLTRGMPIAATLQAVAKELAQIDFDAALQALNAGAA